MGNFREKFGRFMVGRNGIDQLYNFMIWVCIALIVLNLFLDSVIISSMETLMIVYSLFRVLSRDIYQRQKENRKFLQIWNPIKNSFKLQKNKIKDRKVSVYKRCPACKANLRLPRRKGKHTVKCPRCLREFETKIR